VVKNKAFLCIIGHVDVMVSRVCGRKYEIEQSVGFDAAYAAQINLVVTHSKTDTLERGSLGRLC